MEDLWRYVLLGISFQSAWAGAKLSVYPTCQRTKVIVHGNFLLTRNRHFRINVGAVADLLLGQLSVTDSFLPSQAVRAP